MNNTPEKLLVRAIIPSDKDSNLVVLDSAGRYPSAIDIITTTQEEILRKIGQSVLIQGYLTINKQIGRSNYRVGSGEIFNVSDVLTDPVSFDMIQLNSDYQWNKL